MQEVSSSCSLYYQTPSATSHFSSIIESDVLDLHAILVSSLQLIQSWHDHPIVGWEKVGELHLSSLVHYDPPSFFVLTVGPSFLL